MSRTSRAMSALTVAVAFFGSDRITVASQRYRLDWVGEAPDKYQWCRSVGGLNNAGDVAYSYTRSTLISPGELLTVCETFVATASGVIPIPGIGGPEAHAFDLTDSRLVVGGASSADTYLGAAGEVRYYEPFVSQGGTTVALPTPGRGYSYAAAANNIGEVVGVNWSPQSSATVFKWSATGGYESIGDFVAYNPDPRDINERGDVLINVTSDEALLEDNHYRVKTLIYNAGSITSVPDSEFKLTYGSAINDLGAVVSWFASIPGIESHAYTWDANHVFRDLGFAGENSYATDINNAGVVIGSYSTAYMQPTMPFVYTQKDGRQRLADLIINLDKTTNLQSAEFINDRGQIVGIGSTDDVFWSRRIYMATPVPESSGLSAALFAISWTTLSCNRLRLRLGK